LGAFVACVVLVVVLLALARDVKLLFFLNDMPVLLPLIFLKNDSLAGHTPPLAKVFP
jgi:hypothetical protein